LGQSQVRISSLLLHNELAWSVGVKELGPI
jgi:hypothetical protein